MKESDTPVCLTYCHNLLNSLNQLRLKNILCDTTVRCAAGLGFHAHSNILRAASPALSKAFESVTLGCSTEVPLEFSAAAINAFLAFIYSGCLQCEDEVLEELLDLSSDLQVTLLTELCQKVLNSRQPLRNTSATNTVIDNSPPNPSSNKVHSLVDAEESLGVEAEANTCTAVDSGGTYSGSQARTTGTKVESAPSSSSEHLKMKESGMSQNVSSSSNTEAELCSSTGKASPRRSQRIGQQKAGFHPIHDISAVGKDTKESTIKDLQIIPKRARGPKVKPPRGGGKCTEMQLLWKGKFCSTKNIRIS